MVELLNCDCMEYMASLKDKEFDLAIVDPPYGIGGCYEIGLGVKSTGVKVEAKWVIKDWDKVRPTKEYFIELQRVSISQVVFGGNYFTDLLPPSRCWLIWDKMQRINQADAEIAWTSFEGSIRIYQYHSSKLQGFQNPDRFHPTEKPVNLYKWVLKNYAKPGDKILDTHGGSMSIAIACHQMGYDLTLCEIDKDYYEAGVKRYNEAIKQQTLFNYNY